MTPELRRTTLGGLLIVNADDWGLRPDVTDAALEGYRAGRLTSATALVHMEDAPRAAALAQEHGLPVGLHLNLTFPYGDAPAGPRERQLRMTRYFAAPLARRVWDPRMRRLVSECVADQLEAFEALYGAVPTHIDGHHHIHACPTVAFSPVVALVRRMRPLPRDGGPPAARWLAGAEMAVLRRRHVMPRICLPLSAVHLDADDPGPGRLASAGVEPAEVMTHPHDPADRRRLESRAWAATLARFQTGSYAEL